MKLIDFDPRWIDIPDRHGIGFLWRCVTGHCDGYNATLFVNPLDGGPAFLGDSWSLLEELLKMDGLIDYGPDGLRRLVRGCGANRWSRLDSAGKLIVGAGNPVTTFENLTTSPSINAYECGHFTVVNGCW